MLGISEHRIYSVESSVPHLKSSPRSLYMLHIVSRWKNPVRPLAKAPSVRATPGRPGVHDSRALSPPTIIPYIAQLSIPTPGDGRWPAARVSADGSRLHPTGGNSVRGTHAPGPSDTTQHQQLAQIQQEQWTTRGHEAAATDPSAVLSVLSIY